MAFSPDGKQLKSTSANEGTISLWDVGSGAAVQTLMGHLDGVAAAAFSPDSRLLALGSRHKTIELWDGSSGAEIKTLEGHLNFVNAVAFSMDSKLLASASLDGTIKLRDATQTVMASAATHMAAISHEKRTDRRMVNECLRPGRLNERLKELQIKRSIPPSLLTFNTVRTSEQRCLAARLARRREEQSA